MNKNLIGILALGATCALGTNVAKATLVPMNVNSSYTRFTELDSSNPGLERKFDYQVTNNGDLSNLDRTRYKDSMEKFEVSAGTNQGVYSAAVPIGWNWEIQADKTIFSSPDYTTDLYPSTTEKFSIFSSYSGLSQGNADAVSYKSGNFEAKSVNIPTIPEPSTIALLMSGLVSFFLPTRKDKRKVYK